MATTKRKRNSTRAKPNKRPKYIDSTESLTYWEADCILDERTRKEVHEYYIKWKGTDPKTGQNWEPTWEPEANANALLVASWEQEKAQIEASVRSIRDGSGRGRSEQRRSVRRTQQRNRNSRVIDSSPQTSTCSTSLPSSPARDSAGPVEQSSRATTPIGAPAPAARSLPRIQLHQRGDSLHRDEYVRFSQLKLPQRDSTSHQTQDSDLHSSQLFVARLLLYSSGIVQETQDSTGEGSFIPITQQTEDTNLQSTNTNESQEGEDITEDSVRL
jgi:hypothetical protein